MVRSRLTGDHDHQFTIQSISKLLVYGLALETHGREAVLERVGVAPTGRFVQRHRTRRGTAPGAESHGECGSDRHHRHGGRIARRTHRGELLRCSGSTSGGDLRLTRLSGNPNVPPAATTAPLPTCCSATASSKTGSKRRSTSTSRSVRCSSRLVTSRWSGPRSRTAESTQ